MKIAIASGKGGTGKTSIAVMMALSVDNACYVDCDVEEPNGHIFLKPVIERVIEYTEPVPKINENECSFCEKCADACVYKALVVSNVLRKTMFFKDLCHSCGVCKYVCPVEDALVEIQDRKGEIHIGSAAGVCFIEGVLDVGQPSAVPLIEGMKRYMDDSKVNILDTPPGTSCPVVEAIHDADYVILVTEPTPFGLNDLVLSVELVKKLGKKFGVLINKDNRSVTIIDEYAKEEGIDVIHRIPYAEGFMKQYSRGDLFVEQYRDSFVRLLGKIRELI